MHSDITDTLSLPKPLPCDLFKHSHGVFFPFAVLPQLLLPLCGARPLNLLAAELSFRLAPLLRRLGLFVFGHAVAAAHELLVVDDLGGAGRPLAERLELLVDLALLLELPLARPGLGSRHQLLEPRLLLGAVGLALLP